MPISTLDIASTLAWRGLKVAVCTASEEVVSDASSFGRATNRPKPELPITYVNALLQRPDTPLATDERNFQRYWEAYKLAKPPSFKEQEINTLADEAQFSYGQWTRAYTNLTIKLGDMTAFRHEPELPATLEWVEDSSRDIHFRESEPPRQTVQEEQAYDRAYWLRDCNLGNIIRELEAVSDHPDLGATSIKLIRDIEDYRLAERLMYGDSLESETVFGVSKPDSDHRIYADAYNALTERVVQLQSDIESFVPTVQRSGLRELSNALLDSAKQAVYWQKAIERHIHIAKGFYAVDGTDTIGSAE